MPCILIQVLKDQYLPSKLERQKTYRLAKLVAEDKKKRLFKKPPFKVDTGKKMDSFDGGNSCFPRRR